MKEVELKLLAELVENSRRSDRDVVKAIGMLARHPVGVEREGIVESLA
jgi:hypothetical protein